MKYNPVVQELELTGFSQTTNFTIAATGKAFRNLMDGLYGRKIEAVVRELCTNAYDSHTAAGTKLRAFTVQLPVYVNLLFRVRDYGVGMPHEQVMQRYSTLFDSTKDNSDEEVGMLGLGSKSPFAYTDGFTLRCYDGETRRTYACYLGNGGVPTISVADISACDEPRGVEVSFPVKREDCLAFQRAAIRVLKGFPTMPLGVGPEVVEQVRRAPLDYGDGWALAQEDYLPAESNVWVLQGCVYYPVEVDQLLDDEVNRTIVRGLGRKILLDVPVGTVEFTPGRETLSYTDFTKQGLRYYWEKFQNEVNQRFEAELRHLKTEWERAVAIEKHRYSQNYGKLFHLSPYYKNYLTLYDKVRNILPSGEHKDAARRRGWQAFVFMPGSVASRSKHGRHGGLNPPGVTHRGQEILFVHKSADFSRPWPRLAHYMEQHGYTLAVGWETDWREPRLGGPPLASFGFPPVVSLAHMPAPPPPPKPQRAPPPAWPRTRSCNEPYARAWATLPCDPPPGTRILFEYDDMIVEPEAGVRASNLKRLYHVNRALEMQKMELLTGKPGFSIVRLRGNEVIHRWRKYPLYQQSSVSVVEEMSPVEVCRCINLQNNERFSNSCYAEPLRKALGLVAQQTRAEKGIPSRAHASGRRNVSKKPIAAKRNPLLALARFEQRCRRIPQQERLRLEAIMTRLTLQQREHLLDRALGMGLEVLPEPAWNHGGVFPYDLLPLQWENLARMLNSSGGIGGLGWSLALLMNNMLEEH